jgi:hypothetical protein
VPDDPACPPALLRALFHQRPARAPDGTIPLTAQLATVIEQHPGFFWVEYLKAALARIEELEHGP